MIDLWHSVLHMLQQGVDRFTIGDISLMVGNVVLIVFAGPIIARFSHAHSNGNEHKKQTHIFRAFNFFILLGVFSYNILIPIHDATWITRLLSVAMILALGYLGFHVVAYFLRKRFGKEREMNGESYVAETYNSRALTILSGILITIVVLVSVIRTLGYDSLLEAGGVLGIIGVFLALTQASWAPDVISGLIILNSSTLEEGDVIEFSSEPGAVLMVFKTKLFHTELLSLINNHRIMIRNARIRDFSIHNLSRFASPKGLREVLRLNIDYAAPIEKVEAALIAAYDAACKDSECDIEDQHGADIRLLDTGDYALQWGLFYYTKDVKNLLRIRQCLRMYVHKTTQEQGVSLATPILANVSNVHE